MVGLTLDTTVQEPDAGADNVNALRTAVVWIGAEGQTSTTWLGGHGELVVGRDASCDVTLDAASISRRHARLRRTGSAWFVEDLDSRNGSSLNGEPITQAALRIGDVIRIGAFVGIVLAFAHDERPVYELLDDDLFGGPDLRNLLPRLELAAGSDLPVVLQGATGTGKEQFARAIHRRSGRTGAFLAINCAVYQPATAAAELFGYRKGAFTGAERANPGLVRAADGGTLLLDEITDLSLEVQSQLLRVIENRELIPLGESQPVSVNVRFLAATQEPLSAAVEAGRFRADLRARLEGCRIPMPTLAERRGDIPFLFSYLLRRHAAADPARPDARVLERLCLYDWPLNVREMVSLVKRLVSAYPGAKTLSLSQVAALFPELVESGSRGDGKEPPRLERRRRADPRAFRVEEIRALRAALERHGRNVADAAAELGISRQRAYRMLKVEKTFEVP